MCFPWWWPIKRVKTCCNSKHILSWVDCYYIIIRHEAYPVHLYEATSLSHPQSQKLQIKEALPTDMQEPKHHMPLSTILPSHPVSVHKQIKLIATSHKCFVNVPKNGHRKRIKHKNHWHGRNKTGITQCQKLHHIHQNYKHEYKEGPHRQFITYKQTIKQK